MKTSLIDLNIFKPLKESGDDVLDTDIDEVSVYEDTSIPVPGGDKETPTSKMYDDESVPVPSKTEITVDEYNDAIKSLQKNIKESTTAMLQLTTMKVVNSPPEQTAG